MAMLLLLHIYASTTNQSVQTFAYNFLSDGNDPMPGKCNSLTIVSISLELGEI